MVVIVGYEVTDYRPHTGPGSGLREFSDTNVVLDRSIRSSVLEIVHHDQACAFTKAMFADKMTGVMVPGGKEHTRVEVVAIGADNQHLLIGDGDDCGTTIAPCQQLLEAPHRPVAFDAIE